MATRAEIGLRSDAWRGTSRWAIAVWVAAGVYAVLISVEAIYDHSTYRTGFDSAIYDQRLWLLANLRDPFSTVVSRPFLADHFEPGLVLLTPLYWLGLGLPGLYVAQTIGVALTSPALYQLGRVSGASAGLAAIPAFLWLISPAVAAANLFDFRPATFGPLLLVLSVLAALQNRYVLLAITVALALSLKEDVALTYFVLGLLLVHRGKRRMGGVIAGVSATCFLLAVAIIRSLGEQYEWQGRRFAGDRGDSIPEALGWIVRHPVDSARDVLTQSGPDLLILVLSTGALCLLAPIWAVLGAPTAIYNALSAYEPQHDLLNQYYLNVAAAFFIAAAIGVRRLESVGRVGRAMAGACVVAMIAIALIGGVKTHDISGRITSAERAAIERALDRIPPDAPVAAAPFLLPHLSQRVEVYSLPEPFIPLDWGSSLTSEEFAERAERVRFAAFVGRAKPVEYPGDMGKVWNMLRRDGFVPIVEGPHVQILERR